MRARVLVTLSSAVMLAGCIDLFHSTDFAGAGDGGDAAAGDASPGAIDDFCALSEADALTAAQRACAWLSACDSPGADNAAGACLTRAILAFDCRANPNRKVRGAMHDAWRCLANATSCSAVHACIFGGPPPTCGAATGTFVAFTSCSPAGGTRVDCEAAGAPALGAACALEGRTCVADSTASGYCAASAGLACTSDGCSGTMLRACGDPDAVHLSDGGLGTIDLGQDCAMSGAGACVPFDTGGACLASDGATCTKSANVRCVNNVAIGCPSGIEEHVDCAVLGGTCSVAITGEPTAKGPSWDVSRACVGPTTGACTADSCSGSSLVACVHNAPHTIDCAALGLGPCAMRSTVDGASPSCAAP